MVWESPVEDGQGRSGPGFGHRPCLSSGRAMARRSHRSEYAAEWKDAFCLCAAFCANAGFSQLRRFTLGFSQLRRFTQGKWIRVKRQHEARARTRGVCVRHAHVCVCVCDRVLRWRTGSQPGFLSSPGTGLRCPSRHWWLCLRVVGVSGETLASFVASLVEVPLFET